MHLIKKVYCRIFQGVFRLALPFLPYRDPNIYYETADVGKILRKEKCSHPLLVTDKSIRELGLTKELEKQLGENLVVYDRTQSNPTTEMVYEAVELYHQCHCDSIIAFGGGSPMDLAKAVGACVARKNKPIEKMAGLLKVMKKLPLLIAVVTTAGTGSETTLAAVIVDSKTRHKYVINDFALIPAYAVLDEKVLCNLPCEIVAATGMDALTHAIEAYIGNSTTAMTRKDAQKAVQIIFTSIKKACNHEQNALKEMLNAAHLAGRAFTRSYVGYVHAISHSLSGQYNMPHGKTNAVLLPIVLEMYGKSVYKKLAKLCVAAKLGTADETDEVLAVRFIEAIKKLNHELGIPDYIDGIVENDIPLLAKYADKEANPLYPVPVLWNQSELAEIYRKAGKIHGSK